MLLGLHRPAPLLNGRTFRQCRRVPICCTMSEESDYNSRWLKIWKDGLKPGDMFDGSRSAPSLLKLLDAGSLKPEGKRVLVPGCGRGYDVLEFARRGAGLSLGLELSSDAIKAAEAYCQEAAGGAPWRAAARFVQGDFFTFRDDGGSFDIGYDYTFLCALKPDWRKDWAKGWAGLIRPGGELVTLIFPVDPQKPRDEGPPFPVTVELYTDLLTPLGFEQVYLQTVPAEESHQGRSGKEFMARWRKKA